MIVSHAHKFIYIKTYKTGSTSVEAALSGVCGPDDVITEASEQLRGVRQVMTSRPFWRYAPMLALAVGGFMAMQGLWVSRWLWGWVLVNQCW